MEATSLMEAHFNVTKTNFRLRLMCWSLHTTSVLRPSSHLAGSLTPQAQESNYLKLVVLKLYNGDPAKTPQIDQ